MLRQYVVPTADLFRSWEHAYEYAANTGISRENLVFFVVHAVVQGEEFCTDKTDFSQALAEYLNDCGYVVPGVTECSWEVHESMWDDLVHALFDLYVRIYYHRGIMTTAEGPGQFVSGLNFKQFFGADIVILAEISSTRRAA